MQSTEHPKISPFQNFCFWKAYKWGFAALTVVCVKYTHLLPKREGRSLMNTTFFQAKILMECYIFLCFLFRKVVSLLTYYLVHGWWVFLLVLFSLAAQFPKTQFETLKSQCDNNKQHSCQQHHHIQRGVLDPVEVMNSSSEVFGPFMPHHKFRPEDWEVEWVNRAVSVKNWESLHGFLVSGQVVDTKNTTEKWPNWSASI